MSKQTFSVDDSLPFSDIVIAGGLAYVSGQVGFTEEGKLVDGGVEEQTRATIENLKKVLEQAGLSLQNVVRTGCYLTNPEDLRGFAKAYAEFFPADKPARSTVFVAGLPVPHSVVEIDAVAALN